MSVLMACAGRHGSKQSSSIIKENDNKIRSQQAPLMWNIKKIQVGSVGTLFMIEKKPTSYLTQSIEYNVMM